MTAAAPELDRKKKQKPSYPYSNSTTTSDDDDDQYEESEDFDFSENQSSDDASINSSSNRFRRSKHNAPIRSGPYRRRSFTTSKPQINETQSSRNSSIADSIASVDSLATVKLDERSPPTHTQATVTSLVPSSSTATDVTFSVHDVSIITSQPANDTIPESLDLSTPLPTFRTNSMTVQTETVSSVPALAVTAAGGSTHTSLKVKKSIDNVNKSLHRAKKKTSSRLGGQASKSEVFAARIASAVDEAQSSDSDETFVYESNPHESHLGSAPARPRFHTRNSSSSSFPRPNLVQTSSQTQTTIIHSAPVSGTASPNADSYQTLTLTKRSIAQKQYQQQLLVQQQLTTSSEQSSHSRQPSHNYFTEGVTRPTIPQPTSPHLQQYSAFQLNRPYHIQSSLSIDNMSTVQDSEERPGLQTRTASSGMPTRQVMKNQRAHLSGRIDGLRKQASSQLRGLPKNIDYKSTGHPRSRNRGYTANDEEEEHEEGYFDLHGDFDDEEDEYYDYNETTPLKINGSSRGGGHNVQRNPRKNGPNDHRAYSPHNYQRHRRMSRYERIRVTLWLLVLVILVLGTGFLMGFLLATNKPIHSLHVKSIFDILVSDDELLFDVVIEGVNPGFLSIEVSDLDLDVFARSAYVVEEGASKGGVASQDTDDDEEYDPHTMLLGNIGHFDVPLTFGGGFFSKRVQKAVGQLRLIHPGKNATVPNGSTDDLIDEGKKGNPNSDAGNYRGWASEAGMKDSVHARKQNAIPNDENDVRTQGEEFDSGQLKWARVNLHPFDLIIRGVIKYTLPLGGNVKIGSISKVSWVKGGWLGG